MAALSGDYRCRITEKLIDKLETKAQRHSGLLYEERRAAMALSELLQEAYDEARAELREERAERLRKAAL